MSLDRIQSRPGLLALNAEPGYTVASSLSSIGSNQMNGGFQFGNLLQICGGTANSTDGGALVVRAALSQASATASTGTAASISVGLNPVVSVTLSAGGLHNLQPPTYHGQLLTIVNMGGSASFVTGCILSGQGSGSTTTAAIPTLAVATTIAASVGRGFIGLSAGGGSASNSTTCLWYPVS